MLESRFYKKRETSSSRFQNNLFTSMPVIQDGQSIEIRQKKFPVGAPEVQQVLTLLNWRMNLALPLLPVQKILSVNRTEFSTYQIQINVEQPQHTLSNIHNLSFFQMLYLAKQMASGFEMLSRTFGFFSVAPHMIYVTHLGKCKVWIGQFSQFQVPKNIPQHVFVREIIQLIEKRTRQNPMTDQFFKDLKNQRSLNNVQIYINKFIKRHNLKVPLSLSLVSKNLKTVKKSQLTSITKQSNGKILLSQQRIPTFLINKSRKKKSISIQNRSIKSQFEKDINYFNSSKRINEAKNSQNSLNKKLCKTRSQKNFQTRRLSGKNQLVFKINNQFDTQKSERKNLSRTSITNFPQFLVNKQPKLKKKMSSSQQVVAQSYQSGKALTPKSRKWQDEGSNWAIQQFVAEQNSPSVILGKLQPSNSKETSMRENNSLMQAYMNNNSLQNSKLNNLNWTTLDELQNTHQMAQSLVQGEDTYAKQSFKLQSLTKLNMFGRRVESIQEN